MTEKIKIEPIKLKEYETKQSKYDIAPKIPFRSIILGPSGSGKSILLQNMILNIYRNCFSRIYIFSPSIDVDATWSPVKTYIEDEMELKESDKDKFYFDHYDPEDLKQIIDTQRKVIEYMKKNKTIKHYILYWSLLMISRMIQDLVGIQNCFMHCIREEDITQCRLLPQHKNLLH